MRAEDPSRDREGVRRTLAVIGALLCGALGVTLWAAVAVESGFGRGLLALLAGVSYLLLLAVLLAVVPNVARSPLGSAFAIAPLVALAALHGKPGWLAAVLVVIAFLAGVIAYWSGVVVWPDVAIFFVLGLAVVAALDAAHEKPKIEPPPPLAAFDLPASQVEKPTVELRAPTQVDLVAVTPTPRRKVTHETTHFSALLLTRVPRTGPTGAVHVLLNRGDDDATSMALARHQADSTRFFLLPSADCFFLPAESGLSQRQVETILVTYGFSDEKAKDFASSFSGPVDLVRINPGRTFNRYFSNGKIGSFLTNWRFRTSRGARRGLALPPSNKASRVQTVRATRPTMALFGRIKNASDGARQFLVLRPAECFDFGSGRPVPGG
jgi:hypothetical protein